MQDCRFHSAGPAAGEGNLGASLLDGHDDLRKESLLSIFGGYYKNQILKTFRSDRTNMKIAGSGNWEVEVSREAWRHAQILLP